MELLGLGLSTIGLFVGFGLLIGILFGFFGMGGSFLVTPALLVIGYPAPVAVGSGLAFVFGTSIIGALRHRDHGQASYTLAAVMILGLTFGIQVGTRIVFLLADLGGADVVISVVYVGLLGAVGLFVFRDARTGGTDARTGRVATEVQAITLPPMVSLPGGATVSAWVILVVGSAIGVLSGCLGVGGGFLLLPVMVYGFGIPTAIAAGTSILQISVSSAFGTFVYAQSNAVDVPVVAALLVGSALGARIGAGATRLVDEADSKGYFAVMLLSGSVATASKQVSVVYGVEMLEAMSAVLIFGTAVLVSSAIVRTSITTLRKSDAEERCRPPRASATTGVVRRTIHPVVEPERMLGDITQSESDRAPSEPAGRSRSIPALLLALAIVLALLLVRARRQAEPTLEPPF